MEVVWAWNDKHTDRPTPRTGPNDEELRLEALPIGDIDTGLRG